MKIKIRYSIHVIVNPDINMPESRKKVTNGKSAEKCY